jgi:hypothetical protein
VASNDRRPADQSGIDPATRTVLDEFLADVRRVRERLDPALIWQPTLELLEAELEAGQPFLLRCDFASSSRSGRETPVTSE